jgi:hypothetical protein
MANGRMRPWVFMAEFWFDRIDQRGIDYFVDGWQDAGYETVMFGRLDLRDGDALHPSFAPDHSLYRETALRPPELPPHLAPAAERLKRAMAAVRERGLGVCLFSPDPYLALAPEGASYHAPTSRDAVAYYHARLRDAHKNYPMADRILLDGPEWSYEPAVFRYRQKTLFNELDDLESARGAAEELGYDLDRIRAALARLSERLGRLREDDLRRLLRAQKGAFDGVDLLLLDRGLWEWFAFRHATMERFMGGLREVVRGLSPSLKLGLGPRLPSWARLTGCSLKTIARVTDFQAPKVYLWKGGFDGYYGTLSRYVDFVLSRNPDLPGDLVLAVLFRLLGIEMPDVRTVADLERAFPSSYFDVTLVDEIKKIEADVGSLDEVVPYVEVGPHPHGGEPIGNDELRRIVAAMQRAGLTRFIHYWHGQFDEEVAVVREFTR